MLKYGTTKMLPQHMNSILVGAWYAFKMPARKVITDSFAKTKLAPLTPPDLTTNTQACDASVQVPYGSKAEKSTIYHAAWLHLLR